jgi:membrane-associated phospholipid phosphatase
VRLCRAIGVLAASVTLAYRAIAKRPLRSHPAGQLLLRLASDQRRIWSFPVTAARGSGLQPALGVIGTTAALIALDPVCAAWFRRTAFQERLAVRELNRILSGRNMALAINAAWSLPCIAGLIRRNSYVWHTGFLAAEAAANAEILAIAMKHADRRMRPIEVGPDGDFTRTWFRTKNRSIDGAGCFPSGHTAAAFAIAAVFAERYRTRRWAAWAARGSAAIVGA